MGHLSSLLASRAGKLALSLLLAPPIIPTAACVLSREMLSPHALPLTCSSRFDFPSIPDPNLNLNDLGRVGFIGDFESISLYQFEGQTEQASTLNAALLSPLPNGVFAKIQDTDGDVKAMCAYER